MILKANGIIADTITFHSDGTDCLKVAYRFNADMHWSEMLRLRYRIAKELEKETPDENAIGGLVLSIMDIVFGRECAVKMIDFFDNSLEAFISAITPVFSRKIYPACEKARKRKIKEIKRNKGRK